MAALVVGDLLVARAVGPWLVAVDPLVKSDAIFVLDGKTPHRELEAGILFRTGWAPRIIVSHPRSDLAEEVRREFGLAPEQDGVLRLLRGADVPQTAIVRLDRVVDNTLQNWRPRSSTCGGRASVASSSSPRLTTRAASAPSGGPDSSARFPP